MDTLFESALTTLPLRSRGKVRDIYDIDGEYYLIVTTDRLSAFDVVLPDPIPEKGRVLTAVSRFWFERLSSVIGNHLADLDLAAVLPDPEERALVAGRERVQRVAVGCVDDSCQRLETILSAGGVQVQRAGSVDALVAAVADGVDTVFVPLVFDGFAADALLARLRAAGEGPGVIFLLGPSDADDERVTTLCERFAIEACVPLARALDGLVARAAKAAEVTGTAARGVLPLRVFLAVFERVLDYVTRHGRRVLILRVGFSDGPEGAPVPDEVWRHLGVELAQRFRLHDQVARSRSAGVLLLLPEATPGHLERFQTAVFEPVHRVLADRFGRPLPPFVFDAITCPDEARDVPSLLARLT